MDTYVDLDDGPSFLQKRQGIASFTEARGDKEKTIYETERSKHLNETAKRVDGLKSARDALYND